MYKASSSSIVNTLRIKFLTHFSRYFLSISAGYKLREILKRSHLPSRVHLYTISHATTRMSYVDVSIVLAFTLTMIGFLYYNVREMINNLPHLHQPQAININNRVIMNDSARPENMRTKGVANNFLAYHSRGVKMSTTEPSSPMVE